MVTTFQTVASGNYVPNATGFALGIGALPGGNASTLIPMRVHVAQLGNFGTGSPIGQLQVQRIAGGSWYNVSGGTITTNGVLQKICAGVAVRYSIPTLTAPGTTVTAPRVMMHVENLLLPRHGDLHAADISSHGYNGALVATNTTLLSQYGFGRINPSVPGLGSPSKSLVVMTLDTSGTPAAFIESTFRDSDGNFKVQEGATLAASGQVAVESLGEEHHVNYTYESGTDKVFVDVFKIRI